MIIEKNRLCRNFGGRREIGHTQLFYTLDMRRRILALKLCRLSVPGSVLLMARRVPFTEFPVFVSEEFFALERETSPNFCPLAISVVLSVVALCLGSFLFSPSGHQSTSGRPLFDHRASLQVSRKQPSKPPSRAQPNSGVGYSTGCFLRFRPCCAFSVFVLGTVIF